MRRCPLLWAMLGRSLAQKFPSCSGEVSQALIGDFVKSEPRQEKLVSSTERDPIPKVRDDFLCITDFAFDWGSGHNTCTQAYIGGSDLFSVMSKRMRSL